MTRRLTAATHTHLNLLPWSKRNKNTKNVTKGQRQEEKIRFLIEDGGKISDARERESINLSVNIRSHNRFDVSENAFIFLKLSSMFCNSPQVNIWSEWKIRLNYSSGTFLSLVQYFFTVSLGWRRQAVRLKNQTKLISEPASGTTRKRWFWRLASEQFTLNTN